MKMKHKRKARQDHSRRQHAAKVRAERSKAGNESDDPFHGQTSEEPLDTDFDHEVARRVNGYDE